jgi:hypothetical protein
LLISNALSIKETVPDQTVCPARLGPGRAHDEPELFSP